MKLSNVAAKLTSGMKGKAVRVLGVAALAGAVFTAVAPAAQAQEVVFGVGFGGHRVYAPAPVYPYGYYRAYDHRMWDGYAWRDRDDFYRRDRDHRFDRERRFDRDRHFDRDHREFDRDRR